MIRFFKKIFLVANVSLDIVFGKLFFILSSAYFDYLKKSFNKNLTLLKKFFSLLNGSN